MSDETKPTNPKDFIGSTKMPVHLWPNTATLLGTLAMLDGAAKYGRSNWRVSGVKASIYYDAARRHLDAWFEGEDKTKDSKVHHLGHALACIAIIVDAEAAGKLNDDRMFPGGFAKLLQELTPMVVALKEQHKDKEPHHFTRLDEGTRPNVVEQAWPGEEHCFCEGARGYNLRGMPHKRGAMGCVGRIAGPTLG